MTAIRPLRERAAEIAARTGKPESAVLAVMAEHIRAAMARADSQATQLDLGRQLQEVENEIDAAIRRDIKRDAERSDRRFRRRYGLR